MGIHGFTKFFEKCFEKRNFTDYSGSIVIVDALTQIYKYTIGIRNNGKDMLNHSGESQNHLYAIFNYSLFLSRIGLQPLYVFDNKETPSIKLDTVNERKKQKKEADKKCHAISDKTSVEYINNFKKSVFLHDSQIMDCKRLLNAMGIPYVQCIGEADSQCAVLSHDKDIIGVIGDDTDLCVFGSKLLLKDFTGSKKYVSEISYDKIIKYANEEYQRIIKKYNLIPTVDAFTHNNFIDISILFGSPYTPHISNITCDDLFENYIKSGMCVIKTIESIKNICNIPIDFIEKYKIAHDYYKNVKIIDPCVINKHMSMPNKKEIINIMCKENTFNIDNVTNLAFELTDIYNYFQEGLHNNIWAKNFKSYRLKYFYAKNNIPRYKMGKLL